MIIEDTLSQKKERLPDDEAIRLFVCGPTVYDFPHIGNGRIYAFFDSFVKYLRHKGYRVSYLQNITDIDDKIISRAKEEGVTTGALAKRFAKIFKRNMKDLGVDSVNIYAPATDFIPEIIKQVKRLIEKGHAYKIDGDGYYFDLSTFPDYGKLSKRTVEQAEDGVSRIDENPNKRNRGDFCLWKFSKSGEPSWKTDLGDGRPGWHIEDTSITEHFFGPQYEIHGGGSDLMFPHHEAELAQQESASGKKPFVKIWMHVGMLSVNGKKMSKSLGNVISLSKFLKENSPKVFRYLVISRHYRSALDYNPIALEEAGKSLLRIQTFISKAEFAKKSKSKRSFDVSKFEKDFEAALEDDFNTPKALGVIFELINETEKDIWSISPAGLSSISKFVKGSLGLLGIDIKKTKTPINIKFFASRREKFRKYKQFEKSDSLRKKIDRLGYIIEDTPLGPFVWPKHLK